MTTNEKSLKGIEIGRYTDSKELANAIKKYIGDNVYIVCVGTDRTTGDSLAPFVGTFLQEAGYKNVIGTIEDPVHAVNLDEKLKEIPEGCKVLAIDAALGRYKSIGNLILSSGKLQPGHGVGKTLTNFGDYTIKGIVNVGVDSVDLNFRVLSSTRLNTVLTMAKTLVEAIKTVYPLEDQVLIRSVQ